MSDAPAVKPPTAYRATTVLLLRERSGLEAFLLERTSKSSFMPSAYVYPGGRLEPADGSPELLARVSGRSPLQCAEAIGFRSLPSTEVARGEPPRALALASKNSEPGMTQSRVNPKGCEQNASNDALENVATSCFVAGIRESFEEAGVLIAHRASDKTRSLLDLSDPVNAEVFASWRRSIHARERSFLEMAIGEDLVFPLDYLHPFAHWITPECERKRFDTWFFLTLAPANQTLTHDNLETVASEWLAPAKALERHARGQLHLFPPTFRTLEEVAQFDSWDGVVAYASSIPKPPIMPAFETIDGELVAILPGDERYPDATVAPVVGGTRIALQDGHWRSL